MVPRHHFALAWRRTDNSTTMAEEMYQVLMQTHWPVDRCLHSSLSWLPWWQLMANFQTRI